MHSIKKLSRSRAIRGAVLPALLLALWEWVAHRDPAHRYAFEPLEHIASAALEVIRTGELPVNLGASLWRTTIGLVTGIGAGIVVGTSMALSQIVRRGVEPLFQAIRHVPLLGLIPLLSLWCGTGEFAKTFVVFLAAFYPMVTSSYDGIRSIDARYFELADSYRLTRFERLRDVLLPGALPGLSAGVLQALPMTWITATSSELLFNAGAGIGSLMQTAQAGARVDVLLVCVASVTALAAATGLLAEHLSRRMLRWRVAA